MKDCGNQDIIPVRETLSIQTNRHSNCDGSRWGWIEGCSFNICWSDNKTFNYKKASEFVHQYNSGKRILD